MFVPKFVKVRCINAHAILNAASPHTFNLSKLNKIPWVGNLIIGWQVTRDGGSSTIDGAFSGAIDGTNYRTLVSMTQISAASGGEVKELPGLPAELLRFTVTLGSSTDATVSVWVAGFAMGPIPDTLEIDATS